MSCDHIEYSLYKVFDFDLVFICETSILCFNTILTQLVMVASADYI